MTNRPQNIFLQLGLNLTRQTDSAELLSLIKKLRPVDCGKDLVRIGGAADGGYLISNDLEGINYCFSPGVSDLSDFEDHLANLNIKSFLADYSVESPPVNRAEFTFDKKFLGATDNEEFFTLSSWKDKYLKGYTGDLILQMDIEGFEYQVIMNLPDDLLRQFRIIVVEFHALDRLFDPFVFTLFSSCFEKLLQEFHVVHIHPNNVIGTVRKGEIEIPKIMEFTFLNKERVTVTKPRDVFPHRLDAQNTSNPPLHLPKCWHAQELASGA